MFSLVQVRDGESVCSIHVLVRSTPFRVSIHSCLSYDDTNGAPTVSREEETIRYLPQANWLVTPHVVCSHYLDRGFTAAACFRFSNA